MVEKMDKKIRNFYKRWNVNYGEKKQFEEFKGRVLHSFDLILGKLFIKSSELEEDYIKLVGIIPESTISKVYYAGIGSINTRVQEMLTGHTVYFSETRIWKLLSEIDDFIGLIKMIQSVFWLDIDETIKDEFSDSIKKDIDISSISVNLSKTKYGVVLYPKGVKLLDEGSINDVLNWLSKYPNVQKTFQSALLKYTEKKHNRNLVDDLRLSLELLLKNILGNKKSLENQEEPLGKYLKDKKIPKEISGMFWILLDRYSKYQNEHAKHDDKVDENELEFIIYLTGTFMRFLLKVDD